jgi:hypothetical protein
MDLDSRSQMFSWNLISLSSVCCTVDSRFSHLFCSLLTCCLYLSSCFFWSSYSFPRNWRDSLASTLLVSRVYILVSTVVVLTFIRLIACCRDSIFGINSFICLTSSISIGAHSGDVDGTGYWNTDEFYAWLYCPIGRTAEAHWFAITECTYSPLLKSPV